MVVLHTVLRTHGMLSHFTLTSKLYLVSILCHLEIQDHDLVPGYTAVYSFEELINSNIFLWGKLRYQKEIKACPLSQHGWFKDNEPVHVVLRWHHLRTYERKMLLINTISGLFMMNKFLYNYFRITILQLCWDKNCYPEMSSQNSEQFLSKHNPKTTWYI